MRNPDLPTSVTGAVGSGLTASGPVTGLPNCWKANVSPTQPNASQRSGSSDITPGVGASAATAGNVRLPPAPATGRVRRATYPARFVPSRPTNWRHTAAR